MKTNYLYIAFLSILILFNSCKNSSQEKTIKNNIIRKFESVKNLASNRQKELFSIFNQDLSEAEITALQFLYAYMPLSDLADYDGSFYLQHVQNTLKIKDSISW